MSFMCKNDSFLPISLVQPPPPFILQWWGLCDWQRITRRWAGDSYGMKNFFKKMSKKHGLKVKRASNVVIFYHLFLFFLFLFLFSVSSSCFFFFLASLLLCVIRFMGYPLFEGGTRQEIGNACWKHKKHKLFLSFVIILFGF